MTYSYMPDMFGMSVVMGSLKGLFTPAVLGVTSYVLSSLALYTLAQRRGIHKPWLAWIPVVKVWILGSLSDQYRYVSRGEVHSKRKSLLTLSILSGVVAAVVAVLAVAAVLGLVFGVLGSRDITFVLDRISGRLLGLTSLSLPLAALAIAKVVVYFMALSDVYKSMDPGNGTVFLVLSILFRVTEPFFLFFNRNKDLGMPPRRDAAYTEQKSWENP